MQGLYQLMESTVVVRARQSDLTLVQSLVKVRRARRFSSTGVDKLFGVVNLTLD